MTSPLVLDATRRTGVLWVTPESDTDARAVWFVFHDDSAYVLHEGGEQSVPTLSGVRRAAVAVRSKDTGAHVVTWDAEVEQVAPGTAEWEALVPLLAAARLNLDDAERAPQRWAESSVLSRLRPVAMLAEGASLPSNGGMAVPRTTPATNKVRLPFTLRLRRGKRPRG